MLRVVLELGDLIHSVDFWSLLAVHVVVLALPVRPTDHVCVNILMVLELLELRLRLVIRRLIVQSEQVVGAHLLHVTSIVLHFVSLVSHCHVLEHLLLRHRHVAAAHRPRAVLVHRLHVGGAGALVSRDLLMALRGIVVILGGAELR